MSHPDVTYDWEPALESLVDDIMTGRSVQCSTGALCLHDILEGDFILGAELAKIWSLDWHDQLQALDDLRSRSREVVTQFLINHCPEVIEDRARDFAEEE